LFAPNSHRLIPVPTCVAHHPSINLAVEVLEQLCHRLDVEPFSDSTGSGFLRHVAINVERSSGKVQITLVWNTKPYGSGSAEVGRRQMDSLVESLVAAGGGPNRTRSNNGAKGSVGALRLHSLWVHYNASCKHDNAIFDIHGGPTCWQHCFGPRMVEETLAPLEGQKCPVALQFPPNVFRQANLDAFTKIVAQIRKRIAAFCCLQKKPRCVELYGGVGTIGLNVADLFSSLVSSDTNPFNKVCFTKAASRLSSEDCQVTYIPKGAAEVVQMGLLEEADVVLIDPPRKGLDSDTLKALNSACKPQLLVYVSCGFDSFRRDCDLLLRSKWEVEHAEGHLLFPGSDALETLAFLVAKGDNSI